MKWPFSKTETATNSEAKEEAVEAVINPGSTFCGEIVINGHLRTEGKLSGEIRGDSLYLAKGSHTEGFVQVALLTIAGFFKGEVEVTEKLTILATACCEGRIRCARLVVEEGAKVNGQIAFLDNHETKNP